MLFFLQTFSEGGAKQYLQPTQFQSTQQKNQEVQELQKKLIRMAKNRKKKETRE